MGSVWIGVPNRSLHRLECLGTCSKGPTWSRNAFNVGLPLILAADVVGYSRLMGEDEEATLATLKSYRSVIDELIQAHDGRVFGSVGDSVIAEFASPVEAVRCAIAIQEELMVRNTELVEDRRMQFRIGINLGDMMVAERYTFHR